MKGLINNLPNHDYHADLTHLSSSTLKMLLDGPEGIQKFYEERILKLPRAKNSSDAFDFGSLLHAMILEPETVATDFAIYQGWVRRGKEFEDFKAANPGKIILAKPQFKKAEVKSDTVIQWR